jgi:hypothetical protein
MKRALKKKSNIYAYLDSAKVLETGGDQDIANARKEYWKLYKAGWRKKQRQETKEFTIVCTVQDAKDILEAARKHKRSGSNFIKESCIAYMNRRYIVPDRLTINSIRQQLAMNINTLKQLFDENKVSHQTGTSLLQQMAALEQLVLTGLHNPKTLEELITEAVRTSPAYNAILSELLQKL